jgi:hypothetical protein
LVEKLEVGQQGVDEHVAKRVKVDEMGAEGKGTL